MKIQKHHIQHILGKEAGFDAAEVRVFANFEGRGTRLPCLAFLVSDCAKAMLIGAAWAVYANERNLWGGAERVYEVLSVARYEHDHGMGICIVFFPTVQVTEE